MATPDLSPTGALVRRADPTRFFAALFAPPDARETVFALYAFDLELARATQVAREPIAAMIRLQWWREVLEGARRRHEVAEPLGLALDSGRLLASDLMPVIDAREMELEPFMDAAAVTDYARQSAGRVMVAAARTMGMDEPESLLDQGGACGLAELLDNTGRMQHGRGLLPNIDGIRDKLRGIGRDWLYRRPLVPRSALPAALPAVVARRRLRGARGGPLVNRLAILGAWTRGTV